MEDRIYRVKDAMAYLNVSRTTLHEWVQKGLLPRALSLGPRAVGWRKSTLDSFIESRQAATEQAKG